MARICPDCGKFASISEDVEPEVDSEEIDGRTITATVTVNLESLCCAETMATAALEWEYEIQPSDHTHTSTAECDSCAGAGEVECATCGGTGKVAGTVVRAEDGASIETDDEEECGDCSGTGKLECEECGGDGQVDIDDDDDPYELGMITTTFSSDQATVDRHGKPIKNPRFRKTFYGADIEAEVHCNACDEDFTITDRVQEQASYFEEV